MLSKVISELALNGHKIDGVIQHAYNPNVNDAIQFYAYKENDISYIISTYRNPIDARRRLKYQNKTLEQICNKISDNVIKEGILFSPWLVDTPISCYRVQEYKKRKFWFRVKKYNRKNLIKYLNISCDWIIGFQNDTNCDDITISANDVRSRIKNKIQNVELSLHNNSQLGTFLSILNEKLYILQSSMKISAHHGDYCYWNCFSDTNRVFRVIDWEFAKVKEWVIFDYLSNLQILWIDLNRKASSNRKKLNIFSPQSDEEIVLNKKLMALEKEYGFRRDEIIIYWAYLFLEINMRDERPVDQKYWMPFVEDIMSVFRYI